MILVTGYEIDSLFLRTGKYLFFKAFRKNDKLPVLIKVLNGPVNSPADLSSLRYEYEVLNNLNSKRILQPIALEMSENGHALILENNGSELLNYFIPEKGMELFFFLKLAIRLSDVIGTLHQLPLVHLKIRPSNILYHPDREEIYLMDFSSASFMTTGILEVTSADWLKETLAYMSPEQTGRMNRAIDWRTDIYSLGITFYQMLTGQLPFQADDEMEWAHCHIAKLPLPPHKYSPNIPEAVSDIIMMCLSKMAEDRYQNALGLKKDLEECHIRLKESGKIEYFFPGCHDISDRFQIPQKLYGRQKELDSLIDALDRVTATGTNEAFLVSGFAGIGKSFLISELQISIVEQRGYFIRGKFDQYQRYTPYDCLIQAFRTLTKQILTESDDQIVLWKQILQGELGGNGQVIIDVIPELELILGKQPVLQALSPEETRNRFNTVFQQFVQSVASQEHPLVLCLDDLQWADSASLKLVGMLATDPTIKYLLVIGAFRDNEVFEPHPLIDLITELKKTGIVVIEHELQPFSEELVNQFCADTLHCQLEQSEPLARLVFEKTYGNPFFMSQFLTSLHESGLLVFDLGQAQWNWDLEQIEEREITDNVIEFLSNKILKLRPQTQEMIKLAACIGNHFDLGILSLADTKENPQSVEILWELLQEGLVTSELKFQVSRHFDTPDKLVDLGTSGGEPARFKFLHDRVQQAAYSLIDESQRKAMHLKIGRLMVQNTTLENRKERLFDITNQMNMGRDLIESPEEALLLAELNLASGKKAKQASAYQLSLQYLTVGLEILKIQYPGNDLLEDLPQQLWESHYDLLATLFRERAESEYLNSRFDNAELFFEILLNHVRTPLERASVYAIKTVLLTNQGRNEEAVKVGIKGLDLLGIALPDNPSRMRIMFELGKAFWRLRRWKIEKLASLPKLVDEQKEAIMALIMDLYPPAYFTNQRLFALLVLKILTLTLKYGNIKESSPYAYSAFGFLLSSGFRQYKAGYRFAKLGLRISENQNNSKLLGFSNFVFGCFINNWTQPAAEANKYLLRGYQQLVESGSLIYAGYAAISLVINASLTGAPLDEFYSQTETYLQFVKKIKDRDSEKFLSIAQRYAMALQGKLTSKTDFGDKNQSEASLLEMVKSIDQPVPLLWYYVKKIQVLYLFGEFQTALETAQTAHPLVKDSMGLIFLPEYYFFYFLILSSLASENHPDKSKKQRRLMLRFQKQMEKWSRLCPENFLHRSLLMKAELMRLDGHRDHATRLYLEAIQSAYNHGFVHNAGIAAERFAEFCLKSGLRTMAGKFFREAHRAYSEWGATSKSNQMRIKLDQFFAHDHKPDEDRNSPEKNQDLATIIKASQTIGSEIMLDKLLKSLIQIMIENAGANKGFLILKKDTHWMIEAEGSISKEKTITVQPFSLELINVTQAPLPLSVFHYVERTRKSLVLKNASSEKTFMKDPYITRHQPKSMLCSPILHQGKLIGILYLENNLMAGAFTPKRLEILGLLSAQAAISIENARLYADQQTVNDQLQQEINERKEMEKELLIINRELGQSNKELKEAQSQLIQSAKLASIGELATGMAHELNQPLMYIRNSAQLTLMDDVENYDKEVIKDTLQDIEKNTGNMMSIINHLRDFARHLDLDLIPLELHDVLEDSLILINEQLRIRDIQLEKHYSPDLPFIMGSAQQLEQVFINILTNARDAMELQKNAKLIIKTSFLQLTENQGEVTVAFIDNGEGISEQDREKIFDPFFTTKEAGKGTGLGLSISYGIIRDHKGRIAVESNVGSGTTFRVILPVDLREVESLSDRPAH